MTAATSRRSLVFIVVTLLLVFSAFPLVGQAREGTPNESSVRTILDRLNELHNQGATDAATELFDSLSIEEQAAVATANQTVRVVVEQDDSAFASHTLSSVSSSCYGPKTSRIYGTNRLGVVVWNFYQQIQWCASGSSITDAWCSSWAGNVAWGYTWEGHSAYCQVTYGGIGYTSIKYFSQGIFKLCIEWLCQTSQPWIAQQGDYYGSYWAWGDV